MNLGIVFAAVDAAGAAEIVHVEDCVHCKILYWLLNVGHLNAVTIREVHRGLAIHHLLGDGGAITTGTGRQHPYDPKVTRSVGNFDRLAVCSFHFIYLSISYYQLKLNYTTP
jgi:hypothetical protein